MKSSPMSEKIIHWLFATKALRVSPAAAPFWYTSGQFGPYFINTHFLFGSEKEATDFLDQIETALDEPRTGLHVLRQKVMAQYEQNDIFHAVIDQLAALSQSLSFDVLSGGERRDLFFSLPLAAIFDKPHVTILKNGETYTTLPKQQASCRADQDTLRGQKVLHVADLVTEASSYVRAWLPALRDLDLIISDTMAVIDRGQGGRQVLAQENVRLQALIGIEADFFAQARAQGLIDARQQSQIESFSRDPQRYMQTFLREHPDFIEKELSRGGQSRQRALLFQKRFGELADD